MDKVIVITGPTGIGKTNLSLMIAGKYNGEIINADASQFKKDLNIGTAKIDLNSTVIKHHLINNINADEMFSISDYQRESRKIISDIISRDKLPILVGGSGLYINACLNEYNLDSPKRSDNLEKKYEQLNNEELHNILVGLDYNASLSIHPNNRKRVLRAIELAECGNSISLNTDGNKPVYDYLIICLNTDREVLYNRINMRCDIMLKNGWIEECDNLKKTGIDVTKIKDIGYSDIFNYLEYCNIDYDDLKEAIAKKTRNYAKRQITWMKNKMDSVFVEMDYDNIQNTVDEVENLINEFLNK